MMQNESHEKWNTWKNIILLVWKRGFKKNVTFENYIVSQIFLLNQCKYILRMKLK